MTLAAGAAARDLRGQRGARRAGHDHRGGRARGGVLGLRVGAAGAGGELVPTLAVSVAAAAACGATRGLRARSAGGAAAAGSGSAERAAARRAPGAQGQRAAQQLAASRARFVEGDDLRAEVEDGRGRARRGSGRRSRSSRRPTRRVEERLAALDAAAATGDLGRELRRTRDEVATKLDLGRRIQGAAEAAAFRLACSAPLRRLLRRRPRNLTRGLIEATSDERRGDGDRSRRRRPRSTPSSRGREARGEARRPREPPPAGRPGRAPATTPGTTTRGPRRCAIWPPSRRRTGPSQRAARRGAGALLGARADMEAVASAAGEVAERARASGIPAGRFAGAGRRGHPRGVGHPDGDAPRARRARPERRARARRPRRSGGTTGPRSTSCCGRCARWFEGPSPPTPLPLRGRGERRSR